MKKNILVYILLLFIFYSIITIIHFKFQILPAYCDGYWYLKVAENIAKGKGLVENVIIVHFPRIEKLKEFPHPIGSYWNPLNSIVLAGFYKIFGISVKTNNLAIFFIDLLIVLLIFILGTKLTNDITVSFFASFVYIIHPYSLSLRGLAGLPETYTTLFMFPAYYFLYLATIKDYKYIVLSSIFGGLSYLSRNESGLYILFLLLWSIFFVNKDKNYKLKFFVLGLIGFLAVAMPWEIRNYLVFGKYTNQMKRNLFLCNEFFDYLCFDKQWTIKEWLSNGVANIVVRKIASLHYKLDAFVDTISWPLLIFFVFGLVYDFNVLSKITLLYLVLSYLSVGILFSFTQKGGWHAPANFLPFILVISLIGVKKFSVEICKGDKKKEKIIIILVFLFFVSFFLGKQVKNYKDILSEGRKDIYKIVCEDIKRYFDINNISNPLIMANEAIVINYYTDYSVIQIPFDKNIGSLKKAINYYKPPYLILTGYYPVSTKNLYLNKEKIDFLELVYEKKYDFQIPTSDGAGGDFLKIYKINYEKI